MATNPIRDASPSDATAERVNARQALRAVMDQQADRDLIAARPTPRPRQVKPYGLLVAAFSCAWIWFADPAWLRPAAPPAPTPAQSEASLRFSLYLESQRIEAFRIANHRLPTTIEEAGPPPEGVRYVVEDVERYRLEKDITGGKRILKSGDSMEAFLGPSLQVLGLVGKEKS